MQTAAYSGLRAGGIRGALAAYVGFGLPAFLLMLTFSIVYAKFHTLPVGIAVFTGLRAVVIALMTNAIVNLGHSTLKNWRDVLLALSTATFLFFGGPPILAIVATALVASVLYRGVDIPSGHDIRTNGVSRNRIVAVVVCATAVIAGILSVLLLFNHRLAELCALMVKIDLFAFGGGFGSIPLMFHDIVQKRAWLDEAAFMDGIALGQVTPGPIVITATFVGYQVAGLAGAVAATLAIFTPSFLILLVSVPYFDRLQKTAVFRRALHGAVVCFVGLLFAVTLKFGIAAPWDISTGLIAFGAFTALCLGIDILWVVLAGVCASAILL